MLINEHRSFYLWLTFSICSFTFSHSFSLGFTLRHLNFHRSVTIVANWLLILETVVSEVFLMLLTCEALNFDQVDIPVPLHHKMIFPLRMLLMLHFTWIAQQH